MKIKMVIAVLPFVIALASCSPEVKPILQETVVRTPLLTPTPFSAPGSAHPQGNAWVEAYQDIELGGRWQVLLHKGEKAYVDQDNTVLEVLDVQGRVKLENFGEYRYRFYAWDDGYDEIVCHGKLLLKAGNSYTQNVMSLNWDTEVVEIRLISNDQLIGYKLLSINGLYCETPIAFIDSNSDGLVSVQELDTAIAGLHQEASSIAKSLPSIAVKYEADIASASSAIDNGDIGGAYQKIKQLHNEQVANAKQTRTNQVCLSIAVVGGILLLAASLFVPLRKSRISKQNVNTLPIVPAKAVGQPERVENQKGDLEQSRQTPEQTLTPKTKQIVYPTSEITCSNCGNIGLPKDRFCRKCGKPLK